jgi:hypothetical protein
VRSQYKAAPKIVGLEEQDIFIRFNLGQTQRDLFQQAVRIVVVSMITARESGQRRTSGELNNPRAADTATKKASGSDKTNQGLNIR